MELMDKFLTNPFGYRLLDFSPFYFLLHILAGKLNIYLLPGISALD